MDDANLYDTDICTWAEQPAAALRSLEGRRDLPNQLDLVNLAEEVEDVGRGPLNAVSSLIRQILTHLVIASTLRASSSMKHWASEVATFHADRMANYQPSLQQRIELRKHWVRALKIARLKLDTYDQVDWARFEHIVTYQDPVDCCPISLHELCVEDFDFYAAVAKIDRIADKDP